MRHFSQWRSRCALWTSSGSNRVSCPFVKLSGLTRLAFPAQKKQVSWKQKCAIQRLHLWLVSRLRLRSRRTSSALWALTPPSWRMQVHHCCPPHALLIVMSATPPPHFISLLYFDHLVHFYLLSSYSHSAFIGKSAADSSHSSRLLFVPLYYCSYYYCHLYLWVITTTTLFPFVHHVLMRSEALSYDFLCRLSCKLQFLLLAWSFCAISNMLYFTPYNFSFLTCLINTFFSIHRFSNIL
jgi:hypothetical protein